MSNELMNAYKAHEIAISTEKVNDDTSVIAIHVRNVVTGRIEPIILIEGDLEQLDNLTRRIQRSIDRSR